MEIINGYPCFDCADVDLAKRNVDPARPESDPKNPEAALERATAVSRETAVTFGGALKALNEPQVTDHEETSVNVARLTRPGSALDISA